VQEQRRARDIEDAVYGCLIGGAIGDALGAPVEGWYFEDIRARHGRLTTFLPSERGNTGTAYLDRTGPPGVPGAVTDDSTLRHYMCLEILRRGGRITPDDFARGWLERLNPDRLWVNERIVLQKLQIGMSAWDSGRGTPPAGCAIMAIAPMGIVNAGDPDQAYRDAFLIASVNQDGVDRDAAATAAAGIAAALVPGVTWDAVFDAMRTHATDVVGRALLLGERLAEQSSDIEAFARGFYASLLDWKWPAPPLAGADRNPHRPTRGWNPDRYFSGSSLEILPALVGVLRLCGHDANEAIIEGASFGRDCDTIGSLAGSFAGSMQGAGAIRGDWIRDCEAANADLFAESDPEAGLDFAGVAAGLVEVLRAEERRARQRADWLATTVVSNDESGSTTRSEEAAA